MFRGPFSSGRAVVPMTGYYEWVEVDDGGKDPFFIHHPDGQLLHAAGLTSARKAEGGDGWDVTFTIVTREARDAGGEVHDRMPVFLFEDAVADWLVPGKLEPEQKDPLLAQLDQVSTAMAAELVTVPVDRQVNNIRTVDRTDPSLIAPLEAEQACRAVQIRVAPGGSIANGASLGFAAISTAAVFAEAHVHGNK